MSTEENLILWTEVYNGVPGKRGVKCLVSGWAAFPKTDSIFEAREKFKRVFGGGNRIVFAYEENRCSRKFADRERWGDKIVGIFG